MEVTNRACKILRATSDGDDLEPEHLYLVQEAVNGNLTFVGDVAFVNLYQQVVNGGYKKPWLHDVEHLTIDHEGYVYWKDKHVEHFTRGFLDEMKEYSQWIGRWCQVLEANEIGRSSGSVVWYWEIIERVLYFDLEINEHPWVVGIR